MVMVIETVMTKEMAAWMAQLAVAALTQCESKQHCWLERVSTHATAEENEMTYQRHLGHPSDLQIICTETLGVNVDAEGSKLHLQSQPNVESQKDLPTMHPHCATTWKSLATLEWGHWTLLSTQSDED